MTYPSQGIEDILGKPLGIPLFQEQVMELVIHAGYTAGEADNLRRSMAAWRQGGDMQPHRERIRTLMEAKGYASEFIEQIFEQIQQGHNNAAFYIRRLITEGAVKGNDRRVLYVGSEVYEAAGGVTLRDLFSDDGGGWYQGEGFLTTLEATGERGQRWQQQYGVTISGEPVFTPTP